MGRLAQRPRYHLVARRPPSRPRHRGTWSSPACSCTFPMRFDASKPTQMQNHRSLRRTPAWMRAPVRSVHPDGEGHAHHEDRADWMPFGRRDASVTQRDQRVPRCASAGVSDRLPRAGTGVADLLINAGPGPPVGAATPATVPVQGACSPVTSPAPPASVRGSPPAMSPRP